MTEPAVSPLRQRMIEDMTIRRFGAHTRRDYLRQVFDFAMFLGRSPDQAEPEDLRRYQLHGGGWEMTFPSAPSEPVVAEVAAAQ
jgi:hypothetical protein